jgi:WD40 repeat protein
VVRPESKEWLEHSREEVTRILIQGLSDMGYHESAKMLSRESGFELEGPTVAAFRQAVLSGEWAEAEALLFGSDSFDAGGGVSIPGAAGAKSIDSTLKHYRGYTQGLTLTDGANKDQMLFWLRQQKYLELLEKRDISRALAVLRWELRPLRHDVEQLHALSSLVMCASAEDVKSQARWDGAEGASRSQLLSELSRCISASVMIPEHRLAELLHEVKAGWIQKCMVHNTDESPSLYVNHECDPENFPTDLSLVLHDHTDEVWYLSFSHDGMKLATASKDQTVIIYELPSFKLLHSLPHEEAGVCYVAWSPDDSKLITCTREGDNTARIWDMNTGSAISSLSHFQYPVTAAAWAPDGESFVIGSQDPAHALSVWSNDDEMIYKWKEDRLRVYDLALSPDGRRLVVLADTRILVFDFITREKLADYRGDNIRMTSVSISKDSRTMLVGMNPDRLQMMDIETGQIIQEYQGQSQKTYMIRSEFGGANENFIISGSEGQPKPKCCLPFYSWKAANGHLDSRSYIWRATGTTGAPGPLIATLEGHRPGCVNAVTWHPKDPGIIASAGDDNRVRMYGPNSHKSIYLDMLWLIDTQIFDDESPDEANHRIVGEFKRIFYSMTFAITDMLVLYCGAMGFELDATIHVQFDDSNVRLWRPELPEKTIIHVEAYSIVHLEDLRQKDAAIPVILHLYGV